MGVHLRRGDGLMAQHGLNGSDVRAGRKKICCKTVTQFVGCDVSCDTGNFCIFFHETLNGSGSEALLNLSFLCMRTAIVTDE